MKGYSFPKNPELMRVFKDLDLVEQLGTGIIRILQSYDKSVYEFSENFIRVNFKFREYSELVNKNANNNITSNVGSIGTTPIKSLPSCADIVIISLKIQKRTMNITNKYVENFFI